MSPLVQCVPNFSEGRDPGVMDAIVQAVRAVDDVRLVDWSADHDHHRMVVTFVGPPRPVQMAAMAAAEVALARVDLARHHGVHPRLGALDVLPFVPVRDITLADCAALAVDVGRELARRHHIPVFLYEAAAMGRTLPSVRKEAFRALPPDFGPMSAHATAGATVVGAREPLIAYNINLAAQDMPICRQIARELREQGAAGFNGVRALGLTLKSRGITQVSMNITRPAETPLLAVFSYVSRRASELGTEAIDSEVIGALPGFTAFGVLGDALRTTLRPGQVLLENWPSG